MACLFLFRVQLFFVAVFSISQRAMMRLSRAPVVSRRGNVLRQQYRSFTPQDAMNALMKSVGVVQPTADEIAEREEKRKKALKALLPKMVNMHNHFLAASKHSWIRRKEYIPITTDHAWIVTLDESDGSVDADGAEEYVHFMEISKNENTKRRFELSPFTKKIEILFFYLGEDEVEPFNESDGTLTIFLRLTKDKVIGFSSDRPIQSIVPDESQPST